MKTRKKWESNAPSIADRLLTLREAADVLHFTTRTVRNTCGAANESSADGGELGVRALKLSLRTRPVTRALLEVIITGIRRCGDSVARKANLKQPQGRVYRFACSMALATFSISASDSSEIRRYLTLLRCFTTA